MSDPVAAAREWERSRQNLRELASAGKVGAQDVQRVKDSYKEYEKSRKS